MNKTTRTKLQFIVGAILFSSVAVIGCNNGEKKETVKDEPATETKTVTTTVKRDSIDTMVKEKGAVSPVVETKPPQ